MSTQHQTVSLERPMHLAKPLEGKRILLIVENEAVPFDRRMWNMSRALRDFGADVSVICPKYGPDSRSEEILEGVHIHRYDAVFSDGTPLGYLKEYVVALWHTWRLVHRVLFAGKRIHVVHAANPPDIFWPLALYLRLLGIRFVFDEHDLAPETYLSKFDAPGFRGGFLFAALCWCQRLSYRFANVILATNESYKTNAVRVNPRYGRKTFVVRNGPDTTWFHKLPVNPDLKRGRRYLGVYIGVMAVQDGVEYILRALDYLVHQRDYHDLTVYLIGAGDDWDRVCALATELGLDDYVVFTGRIPDGPALEILSSADVALSPDPKNPLNDVSTMTKIMEYMALGLPIVSFDLRESHYSAGGAALYVRDNDPVAFGDGILHILTDPSLAKRMGDLGVRRTETTLSWQRQAQNLLVAYQYALSGRR